jgi:aspartate racemase
MATPIIGILAGMGPRSTAPFIDLVVTECQRQYRATNDADFPPMLIASWPTPFYLDRPLDHAAMQSAITAGLTRLASSGVAFVALPCNSAHIYYPQLADSIAIPLLNMIELAVQSIPPTATRIALLATRPTLAAGLYQAALAATGRDCIVDEAIQRRVDQLLRGIKTAPDPRALAASWRDLVRDLARAGADTALVACTDLNVVSAAEQAEIALLDATHCLARSVVEHWLALEPET